MGLVVIGIMFLGSLLVVFLAVQSIIDYRKKKKLFDGVKRGRRED